MRTVIQSSTLPLVVLTDHSGLHTPAVGPPYPRKRLQRLHAVRRIHQQVNGPKFDLGVWCLRQFLDMRALEEVRRARLDMGPFLQTVAKIAPTHTSIRDMTSVRKALAIAFCTHTAIHRTGDEYGTVHKNTPALLSPLSCLVNDRLPSYLGWGGQEGIPTGNHHVAESPRIW